MDKMKKFQDIIKVVKPKTIVLFFGYCNPPTLGHLVAFTATKKIAESLNADYAIVLSRTQDKKTNPLSLSQKLEYVSLFFPQFNFIGASDQMRTPIEVLKHYNKTYKNLIYICGSDLVNSFTELFNSHNGTEYNFDSIKVISAGERDADSENASGMSGAKMQAAAVEGNLKIFKKGLLAHIREIDAKRLMNDVRLGFGLDAIKESIIFEVNDLRERYIRGEIFLENTFVTNESILYKIINRNNNYITVSDSVGILSKKWLTDIQSVEVSEKIRMEFEGITEMKFSSSDKIKVAKIIGGMLGVDVSKGSNPEQIVNAGLRITRTKPLNAEAISILQKMLKTADDAGILYDQKLVPTKVTPEVTTESKLIKDKKTGREYDPKQEFDDLMHHPDTKAQFKRMKDKDGKGWLKNKKPDQNEDVDSADIRYITDPITGKVRKSRAKRVTFNTKSESIDEAKHDDSVQDHIDSIKVRTEKAHIDGERYRTLYAEDQVIADLHHEKLNSLGGKQVLLPTGYGLGASNDHHLHMKIKHTTEGVSYEGDTKEFESEDTADDDISDEEIDGLISHINDWDDIIDAYDSSELSYVDSNTGEHIGDVEDTYSGPEGAPEEDSSFSEPVVTDKAFTGEELPTRKVAESSEMNEVLSRLERIKAKIRFHRTAPKRERMMMIALKRHSSIKRLGHRARALAIRTMKMKIAKKPLNQLSLPEKERIERIIQRRIKVINRMATRLMPRIRKIEQTRLSHSTFTKPAA